MVSDCRSGVSVICTYRESQNVLTATVKFKVVPLPAKSARRARGLEILRDYQVQEVG